MGYMKTFFMMLESGTTVQGIADWIIKVNMDRNSHITMEHALILAQEYITDYNKNIREEE